MKPTKTMFISSLVSVIAAILAILISIAVFGGLFFIDDFLSNDWLQGDYDNVAGGYLALGEIFGGFFAIFGAAILIVILVGLIPFWGILLTIGIIGFVLRKKVLADDGTSDAGRVKADAITKIVGAGLLCLYTAFFLWSLPHILLMILAILIIGIIVPSIYNLVTLKPSRPQYDSNYPTYH